MGLKHGAVWVMAAAVVLAAAEARGATPVAVRDADGKKLLEMDDPALGNAYQEVDVDGKKVLYVEGKNVLAGDKTPVLVVDDNDVRPAGVADVVLARFDGDDLRHGKGGEVVMNYRHPDLCPTAAANRVYRVDGPALNHAQLVAALYALRPELFKLTDDEKASQKAAYAAAGAEADRAAAEDHLPRPWRVLNGHGPVDKINAGTITFAPPKNGAYLATVDYTAGGGPAFAGAAVAATVNGDRSVWVAYGTPKTVALCDYAIGADGKLSGKWHPWYDQGDPKNVGTEELAGPADLNGDFQITSAKAPTTGAAYAGTVSIKPLEVTGAADDEKPYSVTWTIGGAKVNGIGIRTKDHLYVASGTGADLLIGKFTLGNGSMNGDFFKLGSTDMGGLAATD